MAIYRFKIKFEDYDDVFRVIELRATHTFKDFHEAIQKAIGFDNSKPASFYMSDDHWRKGTEITLTDGSSTDAAAKSKKLMHKSKIADYIEDPHQKIIYISDFDVQWSFVIELIKITDEDVTVSYPRCISSGGTAPKQYKPVAALPANGEEDDDDDREFREKIFQHEEGLDEDDDDEDAMTEGENEEEPEAGADESAEEIE